eukprot:TRINITY_DN5001_c0_g1_i1.p1 TRINITY_DN5001_c0_g1~~TRINITY_DN5001_c0_g1_i1.p1  ORF type:complete len:646 (-),score=175.14 TRINITY_DN5001_c0_g1_i1:57-1973(-)
MQRNTWMDDYVVEEEGVPGWDLNPLETSHGRKLRNRMFRKRKLSDVNDEDLSSLNVTELKEKCRVLGVKTTGDKATLLARIKAAQNEPSVKKKKTESAEISNKIREGLLHFFGPAALEKKPKYHEPEAKDVFDESWPEEDERPLPFLEETAENLQAMLQADEIFAIKGTIRQDPTIILKSAKMYTAINFPLNENSIQLLNSVSADAPFGRGEQTVVDLNVRRCREITTERFEVTNPMWRNMFSSSRNSKLLEEIRVELSPNNTEIVAELYKLLFYPPGSFFTDHVDTQRDPLMFGTLVVDLPNYANGGELSVFHNNKHIEFTKEKSKQTMWVAFYSSCTHNVAPIASGYRCALVYNLKRVGEQIGFPLTDWATRLVREFDKVFEFGDEEEYGADFTIAHLLDHKYALSHIVPTALKGQDAKVFHALKQANKFDLLLLPIQIERSGIGGDGEITESSEAESVVDDDWQTPIVETYPIDPSKPAHGGVHKQSYAVFTKSPLESMSVQWIEDQEHLKKSRKIARAISPTGNEGTSALMFYVHAGLFVRRKKGTECKVFPAGLVVPNPTLEYYVANTNTNKQQATDDLAPTAGVQSKKKADVAIVDLEKEENDMERLDQLEKQVGNLIQRVSELEKLLKKNK